MTQGLIEQRRHSLVLDVPETGLSLEGDSHRLAQVVSNLLTNAARYMEPGGSISVRARSIEERIELSVRDTGPGIAPDVLPTIFELFTQGPQSIERRQGGLGFGLFIVRSLVALHGGTVDVSTALGQGTELIVSLPRSRALSSRLPARMLESHGPGALGRKVLVVDDNVDAADLVAEGLRIHGCEVSVAHDAPSSLQLALSQRPEVAIVDIGLPGIDGWELGTQLRALPGMHGLRVIAVSGYGQGRDRSRSSAASFAAHLVKPVDLEALLAALA